MKNCEITNIYTSLSWANNIFSESYGRKKVEIVGERGEMKDWASGHFSLFSLRGGKCGGEGHWETKHTAHKQHSWRNHWNIALCFLWAVIGPGAFFPLPLSMFLSVSLSLSLSVYLFLCTCFGPAWCSLETQTAKANDFGVKGHLCGHRNDTQYNKYRKT